MAKFGLVCAVVLAFALPASALKANSTIPITQKVTIDGTEVYGQSSGHASLNTCVSFDQSTVNDAARPSITVCGSQTKVTVFLLNRCDNRHNSHTVEIGVCNSGAASGACTTLTPSQERWMQTAQSYQISQCAV
jgi:hypothetical protein